MRMTTTEIAKRLGEKRGTIIARAKRRGVKPIKVEGRNYLWATGQVRQLAKNGKGTA